MRKNPILAAALVLAAAAFLPTAARAQEDGYRFRLANFSIELLGGFAKANPADFNQLASAEESYLQYYYVTRFAYYKAVYGDSYQVTSTRTGNSQFVPISTVNLAGFRLRYELSPSLGLSLGLQVLDRQQHSSVGMTVNVTDESRDYVDYNGPRSYGYQNSGFLLGVRAWFPQLGAHFGWRLFDWLRFEALVAGGPFYISCHAVNERRTSTTDASGFVSSTLYRLDMQGTSKGFAGELGGRLSVKTAGFLDLFVEAAFTFRDADELKGPGTLQTAAYDSNSGQDPVVTSWNGTWEAAKTTTTNAWGTLSVVAPQNKLGINEFTGMGMRKFTLALSGFQLKAGLSIRFGRPVAVDE